MKKISVLLLCLAVGMTSAIAQKVTAGDKKLAFLKEGKAFKVVFDYSNFTVQGKPEATWVAAEVEKRNAKEAGSGDTWKTEEWEKSYHAQYEKDFINYFNQETEGKITASADGNAPILATVVVKRIDPGVMAGPFSKPAIVWLDVVFTKAGASDELARMAIDKAPTSGVNVAKYVLTEQRIGNAFAIASTRMAQYMLKVLK